MKPTRCNTYDEAEKLWGKLWKDGRDTDIISARDGTDNWIVRDRGINKLKDVKG